MEKIEHCYGGSILEFNKVKKRQSLYKKNEKDDYISLKHLKPFIVIYEVWAEIRSLHPPNNNNS